MAGGVEVIPTVIVLGFILGRWPWVALAVAAVGWPVLLLVTGTLELSADFGGQAILAALLASVNAGVGILAHQALLWSVRLVRRRLAVIRNH